ncbi:MAG TPA: hypothetical protein VFB62_24755 [Polyangiaceae bacterium]|nr:hypothetical protein [Polyangiaceae bacterium]
MVKIGRRVETIGGHTRPVDVERVPLERLVKQALARVLAEEQRASVLENALVEAGRESVPGDLGEFAVFLFGPLREAVTEAAGEEAADRVIDHLDRLLGPKIDPHADLDDDVVEHARSAVVVLEPDNATRIAMVALLGSHGLVAIGAADDNVALAMCARYRPRAVVVDAADGRARKLVALLRMAFASDAPAMVVMTEPDEPPPAGAAAHVQKPVDVARLAAAIRSAGRRAG